MSVMLSLFRPSVAIAMALAAPASFAQSSSQSGQALANAVRQGQIAVVQSLIEGGADANACGGDMVNPLQIAAERGNAAMVTLLLDEGAPADGARFGGRAALMAAVSADRVDAARVLIERHASLNAQDQSGRTRSWKRRVPGEWPA